MMWVVSSHSVRFTSLVGCDLPVQLAAMGGVGSTELASAVAGAGGLGMVPNGTEPGARPCGVNFLVPFVPSLEEITATARQVPVIEFFYGEPRADLVNAARAGSAAVGWQVGSGAEAAAAELAGCDYVVAQGTEAGGHVRGRLPLQAVLAEVRDSVRIPIVAAGGIATAEHVLAAMRSRADAVRVGTRFVTCPESGAHPDYIARLIAASAEDTILTEWYCDGWPDAPHRVLRSALDAAQASGWRGTIPPRRGVDRPPGDMAMYAGRGVGDVRKSEPAADVVRDLVRLL
jgi:NAD(P)H-dependent flavin oxidoreductase YrpB (nitropropane dioxygenase family)